MLSWSKTILFNYQARWGSEKMLVYTYGNKANIRVNGNTVKFIQKWKYLWV